MGREDIGKVFYTIIVFLWVIEAKATLIFKPVDNSTLYVAVGETLEVECILTRNPEEVALNCSKLLWKPGVETNVGEQSNTQVFCVSLLNIKNVTWFGNHTFYCDYSESLLSRSLTIISGHKPAFVPVPTIEWLEKHEIRISWQLEQSQGFDNYRYTLEYNCSSIDDECDNQVVPVNYGYHQHDRCTHAKPDYQVLLPTVLGVMYTLRIAAENNFGKTYGRWLKIPASIFPRDIVPEPVKNLNIFKNDNFMRLTWQGSEGSFRYKISSTCLLNGTSSEIYTESNFLELISNALPAFKNCTFCVRRQLYPQGKRSCERCNIIQTWERAPSKLAQLIPCEQCWTINYFGGKRDVNISWKLPEKKYWNGLITRQVIFYSSSSGMESRNITVSGSHETTFTLKNLKIIDGYYIYVVICNSVACSEKSRSISIPPSKFKTFVFSGRGRSGHVIGISLGILAVFFIIIFVVLFLKRHKGDVDQQHQQQSRVMKNNEEREVLQYNNNETDM